MPYGNTGSVDKRLREQVAALGQVATDFTSATCAGSTTAQTVTINDAFGKITCLAAAAQIPDSGILTITVTNSLAVAGDICFCTMSLSSGTAPGYTVLQSVVTANTITIIVQNSGATNWNAPVFLVNFMLVKSLSALVAN